MTLLQALLLGFLQGLTEFIPVSSTAHLLIGQQLLGLPASDAMFSFLVIVQLGTVVSLFIFFWKDLWQIVRATLVSISTLLKRDTGKLDTDARLGWYILIATLPALLAGTCSRMPWKPCSRRPCWKPPSGFWPRPSC